MTPQVGIALGVGLVASVEDLVRRRISNWIPAAAFLSGVGIACMEHGWRGLVSALLGTACGFTVFLLFYLLGGMGGGDIKLMAGFGSVLGSGRSGVWWHPFEAVLWAALWVAICGAILALAVIAFGALRRLFRKAEAEASRRSESIPYAPAIALGVWLSLVPKV